MVLLTLLPVVPAWPLPSLTRSRREASPEASDPYPQAKCWRDSQKAQMRASVIDSHMVYSHMTDSHDYVHTKIPDPRGHPAGTLSAFSGSTLC